AQTSSDVNDQKTDMTRESERDEVIAKATLAKKVAPEIAQLGTGVKNQILLAAAEALLERSAEIIEANSRDIAAGRESGMAESLIDRLALDEDRIEGIAGGLRQVAGLTDPVGEVLQGRVMENGIQMRQIRVPLG